MMEQKHTWFNPTQAKGINKINIGTIYRGKHWPNQSQRVRTPKKTRIQNKVASYT